jgi:hypothetical protein
VLPAGAAHKAGQLPVKNAFKAVILRQNVAYIMVKHQFNSFAKEQAS